MYRAYCEDTGETYDALLFATFKPSKAASLLPTLVCPDCRNPAFFRKATKDGRSACFFSRPHGDECEAASASAGAWGADGPEVEDKRDSDKNRIVVDFKYGSVEHDRIGGGASEARMRGRGRRFAGGDEATETTPHRRPIGLLRRLIEDPSFATSAVMIELPERIALPASRIFVHVDDLDDEHENAFRGYWGRLTDVNRQTSTTWLNSKPVSIPLNAPLNELFDQRYRQPRHEYAGADFLIFGEFRISSGGTRWISISDLDYLALQRKKKAKP